VAYSDTDIQGVRVAINTLQVVGSNPGHVLGQVRTKVHLQLI